jgi:hypothetical protein
MDKKEFSKAVGTVLGFYKERVKNLKGITDIDNALKEIGRTQEVKRAKELVFNITMSNSNLEIEDRIRTSISDIMLFESKETLDGNLMLGYYYKEQA